MMAHSKLLKRPLAVLTALLWIFTATASVAHEIRPAIVDVAFTNDGGYRASIAVNLEALVADIGAGHDDTAQSANAGVYDTLRTQPAAAMAQAFKAAEARILTGLNIRADGARLPPRVMSLDIPDVGDVALARISTIVIGGDLPAGAQALTWAWSKDFGAAAVRVLAANGQDVAYAVYLKDGKASDPIPLDGVAPPQAATTLFADYASIGFAHIVPMGLDHILFVVGLFLLSAKLSSLLWQVSSFTVAHTVTLALGMLGLVTIPPAIVEPLIAASIVYVGVENILTAKLHRWRPALVFGFGLLHGLGFAGVLKDIGVQTDHFVLGLIAFNVGVELGQLTVIALCFAAVGLWFRHREWYRTRITIPASVMIAVVGGWWFIERTIL